MNEFEQVFSDRHWMSTAGVVSTQLPCPGGTQAPCPGEGGLYSEVQCIMGNGHMGSPCGQTDARENITFHNDAFLVIFDDTL